MRQFLCDEFYLLLYTRIFARILCGKYICRKTSLPVFMWQTKIVNYEYLFVYMTRRIFVTCIYLHVCQALCDYNIALKTSFLHGVKKYVVSFTRAIIFVMENCQTKIARVNGTLPLINAVCRNPYARSCFSVSLRLVLLHTLQYL